MAADVLSVIQDVLNQDKQQKREHAKVMREVQKKLKEKEVSEEEGDKEEYTAFVNKTLKKYGVKSPADLSPEDKKRFYDELDAGWKADNEKPEPEDKEEEADLKTRVKDRMKAEQDEDDDVNVKGYEGDDSEDDDEPEGGDEGDEDEEGGDEDEPSEEQIDKIADLVVKKLKDKADAEEDEEEEPMKVGGEEEIDTKPKAETHDPRFMGTQLRRSMGEALKQVHENSLDEHCGICGEQGIHEQDEWVDAEAKKVQHKWKRMNTRDRVKWLDKMDTMAGKHNTSDADLADILDDYGLTKEEVEEEVVITIESAMLQAKMALGDARIKHKEHEGKIIVNKKDKKKAMDVLLKSFAKKGNPPELTIASGSFQEDVDRAKDDSIEGPAKGVKHKCPTHVKRETKEGYEYGRNVSHTISENVVDFINIIWLDSNKLQEMVPVNEVEIISEGPHSMKNHREKFKATTKIAEAYARLPKMDKEKYQKRDGLEGPIMTASGKVLYFDPKYTGEDGRKGTYYDPDTDFYIDQKMFKAYDDTSKLKFYKSPFDDPDSKEWKKLQRDRERFEKSLLKGATKRSKKDRLKIESTGLKFARKFYQKGEQDDGSEE